MLEKTSSNFQNQIPNHPVLTGGYITLGLSEAGSAISLSSESDVSSEISSSVDMMVATVLIGVVFEWKCINGSQTHIHSQR